MRSFTQVDVFTASPLLGNPVAVVLDAEGMSDDDMAQFANWTNLSETTFVLPPTNPNADYRVRIFTPDVELPFAGHPTIGTCHGWLEAGGVPKTAGTIRQECGVGLVTLRHADGRLAFAAPPLIKGGPVSEEQLVPVCSVHRHCRQVPDRDRRSKQDWSGRSVDRKCRQQHRSPRLLPFGRAGGRGPSDRESQRGTSAMVARQWHAHGALRGCTGHGARALRTGVRR